MTITKNQSGDKLVIALEGRLDTTTAPQLQTELLPEFDSCKNIELDFRGITYVSSAGLRVIVMGAKTAKAGGGKMTIVNVSGGVMEVFEMIGFSDILNIE